MSRAITALLLATVCLLAAGCRETPSPGRTVVPPPPPPTVSVDPPATQSDPAEGLLVDVTSQWGIQQSDVAWPDGAYLTPEITPGGVALLDYDGDGDLDIYVTCHGAPAPMPRAFQGAAPNRLYQRQQDGTYVEVPGAAGLADPGYGHGAAVSDVDNDGDLDVYVTNYGPDAFFVNNGDGTFTKATSQAGFSGDLWSSAASFLDYDRDGHLDLYVAHFATFDASQRCQSSGQDEPDYCGPHTFPGQRDTLYRNQGDGTFRDVSADVGIDVPARGWGVICADLTDDGWTDIYVANDEEPNQLWVNGGDGTFLDEAVLRGAAFNGFGRVEASMGVTIGDVDEDGKLDLFMTHVASETNTLYTSGGAGGGGMYTDRSAAAGLAAIDLPYTGWGCGLFDLDHDGDLDLAVANGRVAKGPVHPDAKVGKFWNRYAEPNLLFRNDGAGRFVDLRAESGDWGQPVEVTRALAFGDLDHDGDLDLVTVNVDNQLRIFRNDAPATGTHWLMVRALTGGRDALGAKVTVVAGGRQQLAVVQPSYSYLSSNDPHVHFGLGGADTVDHIEITWPDGLRERFEAPGVDRYLTVQQGTGEAL